MIHEFWNQAILASYGRGKIPIQDLLYERRIL